MEEEEYRATFKEVSAILNENGLEWLVNQILDKIKLGKLAPFKRPRKNANQSDKRTTTSEHTTTSEIQIALPLDNSLLSTYPNRTLAQINDGVKGVSTVVINNRSAEVISTEYTEKEKVVILIDSLETFVSHISDILEGTLKLLYSDISEFIIENAEFIDEEGESMFSLTKDTHLNSYRVEELKSLISQLRRLVDNG